ncbi:hypothetical protein GCM10022252_75310 [Streptosporangium oxazolinicum]|uniref:Uncharacterized protein n=1 Tax=Streptosporangium oxazolinicum TaxID=909287 RepID=A0ABP8BKQ6_9ACTN
MTGPQPPAWVADAFPQPGRHWPDCERSHPACAYQLGLTHGRALTPHTAKDPAVPNTLDPLSVGAAALNLTVHIGYAVAAHVQDQNPDLPLVVTANHFQLLRPPPNASNDMERANPSHGRHHSQHGLAWTYWMIARQEGITIGAYGAHAPGTEQVVPRPYPAPVAEPICVVYEYGIYTDPSAIAYADYVERVQAELRRLQGVVINAHQAWLDAEDQKLLRAIVTDDVAERGVPTC